MTITDNTLRMLDDVAASFASFDGERVRALRDHGGQVDRAMWERLAANGWLGILVPEELDGAGLSVDAAVIVARRLGAAAFPEPFVACGVLAPLVLSAAEDDERGQRLACVLNGDHLAAVAWRPGITCADGVLTGTSRFVGAGGADGYAVSAAAPGGTAIYWVDRDAAGVSVTDERAADGTLSAKITLDAAPATQLIGARHGGARLEQALDVARVVLAAELVGIMDAALDRTLEYLNQRKQFGVPIGSFQALQHRAVDAWIQRELASAALDGAVATYLDPAATPRAKAAAAAGVKARTALAAPKVCGAALQLHGAIAYTDEYDIGLYLNRALALAPWLGNAADMTLRFGELS